MILVLAPDAPDELVGAILRDAEELGWRGEVSRGEEQTVVALSGEGDVAALEDALERRGEIDVVPVLGRRQYARLRARRRFMTGIASGLGLATAFGVGIPIVGFLLPPRRGIPDTRELRAASVGEIAENEAKLVRFQGRPVLLIHREGGRYFALSAVCTHMSVCQVDWNPERRQLVCPCHGGAFDVYGNVVQGPPSIPLPRYEVERVGDGLFLRRRV